MSIASAVRAASSSASERSAGPNGAGLRVRTNSAPPSTCPRATSGTIRYECTPASRPGCTRSGEATIRRSSSSVTSDTRIERRVRRLWAYTWADCEVSPTWSAAPVMLPSGATSPTATARISIVPSAGTGPGSSPLSTASRRSTVTKSAKRGITTSTNSWAVRCRSSVVPIRLLASLSSDSRCWAAQASSSARCRAAAASRSRVNSSALSIETAARTANSPASARSSSSYGRSTSVR